MAHYLTAGNAITNINDNEDIFKVRTGMNLIAGNLPNIYGSR